MFFRKFKEMAESNHRLTQKEKIDIALVCDNQTTMINTNRKSCDSQPNRNPHGKQSAHLIKNFVKVTNEIKHWCWNQLGAEISFTSIWVPGHTDGHPTIKGCIGNQIADRKASEAADTVAHDMANGEYYQHLKTTLQDMKNEVKQRIKIVWRTFRSKRGHPSQRDRTYVAENFMFLKDTTRNWSVQPSSGEEEDTYAFSEEMHFRSPPYLLVNNPNRLFEKVIARIRLGITPTNENISRRYYNDFPIEFYRPKRPNFHMSYCNGDDCYEEFDSARHRIFDCNAYRQIRANLYENIVEIFELKNITMEGFDVEDREKVVKMFFTWEIMINHNIHELQTEFKEQIINDMFLLKDEVAIRMKTLLCDFLNTSDLIKKFGKNFRVATNELIQYWLHENRYQQFLTEQQLAEMESDDDDQHCFYHQWGPNLGNPNIDLDFLEDLDFIETYPPQRAALSHHKFRPVRRASSELNFELF
jgi:hypothetical protein